MQYNGAIKLTLGFCLLAQLAAAQAGNLYLRLGLGAQTPLAKKTYTEWRRAQVRNNLVYIIPVFAEGLEYYLGRRHALFAEVFNGQAGYSVGTRHRDDCGNPGAGYSENALGTATAYVRINAGHLYYVKYRSSNKFHVNIALQYGLGIDFYYPQNDGIIIFPGVNRCGEVFYLKDTLLNLKTVGLVLPLQVNFQAFTKKRMSVCLSLFYHAGLTKHADVNIDYTTNTYVDRSSYILRGSSYGFKVSYPFKLISFRHKKSHER
jgi:hypothetical protein